MYSNILVPVAYDGDHEPSAALDVARKLASSDAKITLFHVMEEVPSYALSYLPGDFRSGARKAIEADMIEKLADFDNAEAVVVLGHAGRDIVDYANKNQSDLVIIASHRPELSDLILGSTAARVVRHAACAVHVMRDGPE